MTMKQPEATAEELQNPHTPEGQGEKTYSEEEYKNAQAFGTKAQQEKIAYAEKLVTLDPKQLNNIEDIQLQNKVVEKLYGVSNLEELKILNPELFTEKGKVDGDDEDDELLKLQKEVKIMKYRQTKGALDDAINAIVEANKDLSDTIPSFKEKMLEEIKFLSSEIPVGERVAKGFKLVAGTSSGQNAYLALQGKTVIKTTAQPSTTNTEDLKAQLKGVIKI